MANAVVAGDVINLEVAGGVSARRTDRRAGPGGQGRLPGPREYAGS